MILWTRALCQQQVWPLYCNCCLKIHCRYWFFLMRPRKKLVCSQFHSSSQRGWSVGVYFSAVYFIMHLIEALCPCIMHIMPQNSGYMFQCWLEQLVSPSCSEIWSLMHLLNRLSATSMSQVIKKVVKKSCTRKNTLHSAPFKVGRSGNREQTNFSCGLVCLLTYSWKFRNEHDPMETFCTFTVPYRSGITSDA